MSTVLIVVIVVALVLGAVLLFASWRKKQLAEKARLRDRLGTEAQGHADQVVANKARAREMADRTNELKQEAAAERKNAERLREEADRREKTAVQLDEEAAEVAVTSKRARGAATRHDERAKEAKEKLEKL